MANVTNHAISRFVERVKNMADTIETKAYITQNRDKLVEDINKLLEFGNLIYTGQINGDKSTKNYWLNGNVVVVTDTGNSTIITLYKVDFGFGETTDKMIVDNLVKDITEYKNHIQSMRAEIDDTVAQKKTEVSNIESEIDNLKQRIFMLEHKKTTVENEVKVIYNDVEMVNKEMEVLALKICNSLEYRRELAKLNGGK